MIERQKEQQRERRLYCIFNAPQVKSAVHSQQQTAADPFMACHRGQSSDTRFFIFWVIFFYYYNFKTKEVDAIDIGTPVAFLTFISLSLFGLLP